MNRADTKRQSAITEKYVLERNGDNSATINTERVFGEPNTGKVELTPAV